MAAQKRTQSGQGGLQDLTPLVRSDVNVLISAQAISTYGSFITRAALPLLAIIGLGINSAEAAALAAVDLIAGAVVLASLQAYGSIGSLASLCSSPLICFAHCCLAPSRSPLPSSAA